MFYCSWCASNLKRKMDEKQINEIKKNPNSLRTNIWRCVEMENNGWRVGKNKNKWSRNGMEKERCSLEMCNNLYLLLVLLLWKNIRIKLGISYFQFTTLTTKTLMFLMICDCFNVMYSTQILGSISFNLIIPKLIPTVMQLNLITITLPFLAGLINFYEKTVCKELNQVAHEMFIFFIHVIAIPFFL